MCAMPTLTSNLWVSIPNQIHNKVHFIHHQNHFKSLKPISKITSFSSPPLLNKTHLTKTTDFNAKIRQFCQLGNLEGAVNALYMSQKADIELGTLCILLQLCAEQKSLHYGQKVHSVISSNTWQVDAVLGAKLVFMYVNCGGLAQGREIFDEVANEKVYLWNLLINEYCKAGDFGEGVKLYCKMRDFDVQPNTYTYSCVLKCFSGLGFVEEGEMVHGLLLKLQLGTDIPVVNSLISFYHKCGRIESSRKLFDGMLDRDVISWNSIISGYVSNCMPVQAFEVFKQMLCSGVMLNLTTLTGVFVACEDIGLVGFCTLVHGFAVKSGLVRDITCCDALIHMYSKCGDLDCAMRVFEYTRDRSVLSWTSMMAAFARENLSADVIRLFREMIDRGVKPDTFAITSVFSACASKGLLNKGKQVHCYIVKNRMIADISVCNALMDMYSKCGTMEDAKLIFGHMSIIETVSWNTMIGGYTKNGLAIEALDVFLEMQKYSKPDCVTMSSILPACASLAYLDRGKEIHAYALRNGHFSDLYVANAVMDMYVKCGALRLARVVFDNICRKDLFSWTIMIAGYCLHACGTKAMNSFNEMSRQGIEPNGNSFISILRGCAHAGLLDEGRKLYSIMCYEYEIVPTLEHYTCMVDLLANAGKLSEAYKFIKKMRLKPDAETWGALLRGCRVHHDVKLAEKVAEHVFELEPDNKEYYILLANIYTEAKTLEKVEWLKSRIRRIGRKKNRICSWIEVKGKVQIFFEGHLDEHPEYKKITALLKKLKVRIQNGSYTQKTKYGKLDEKEVAICGHSEIWAMAFGVLSTAPGKTLRVTKNARVCHECHEMAKFMSKTYGREIILRDCRRFHHFKNALCSCRG